MTPQRPLQSPTTMDSLHIEYEDLKKEIKADADYWTRIVMPYPVNNFEDSLDYEDMLYDDYSNETDAESY